MDQDEIDTNAEANKTKDRIEKVILPNGSEVVIAGIADHTTSLGEVKNVMYSLEECVRSKGKENVVFLGESSAVSAGVSKESVEIAIFGGDQQAMARKAKELEVSAVDTWDMSFEEQIGSAKKLYGAENALLWMLSQASIHLKKDGKTANIENILSMLALFDISKEKIASSLGDPVVFQALEGNVAGDQFLQEHTGFTLQEVNDDQDKYKQLSQVAYPFNTEDDLSRLPEGLKEAGKVAGGLSRERDKYFTKKVDQYSQQGKTVFVSCGGAHVDNFLDVLHKDQTQSQMIEKTDSPRQNELNNYINEWGKRVVSEDGFQYYVGENPEGILNKLAVNGYIQHGSTLRITGSLEPHQGVNSANESSRRRAIYMTNNPPTSEFAALTSGKADVGEKNYSSSMSIVDGQIHNKDLYFQVEHPENMAEEGYIYIFDRENKDIEFINGEFLSYDPLKPMAIIKIGRTDFPYEVLVLPPVA